jgi:hypothetical protein
MADEIKIENIGGENGVASEVTLVRLVAAMEKLAKQSGADPKAQAAKTQKAYNKAQESGVKVSTKHRDAIEDNTDAVKTNTKHLNLMGSGLFKLVSMGIGAAVGAVKGFAEELISGGDSLSSFARHIPVVGNTLTMFTGLLDNSYQSFQLLAKSGADFGYNLENLRTTAATARLELGEFTELVGQSSTMMASFGGTVTQGARRTAALTDALGTDLRIQLQSMGLSMEEINEQMVMNAYLNRAGSRAEVQDKAFAAEASAELTKNMLQLAKLTGEDVKTQQDKIAQAQMDVAFQMELAKLDADERKKVNLAMAEAQATGGKVAVDALKAEFLGMPPLTRELQLFTATMPESAQNVRDLLGTALNTATEYDVMLAGQGERMATYLENQVKSAGSLEAAIKAGVISGEGVGAEIAALFGGQVDKIAPYFTKSGEGLIFAKDKFLADFETITATPPEDGELGAMAQFLETVKEAKLAIVTNLINPLLGAVTEVFNPFNGWFTGFIGEQGEGSTFKTALSNISKYITGTVNPALKSFFKTVDEKGLGEALKEALYGDGKEKKGMIEEVFKPIGVALAEAVKSGFATIFSDPAVVAGVVAAITALFAGPALGGAIAGRIAAGALAAGGTAAAATKLKTPTGGPTVGRNEKGQFTSLKNTPKANPLLSFGKAGLRGLKFVPGVGLVAAGAMGLFDSVQGFNADPNAGFGESTLNAGSSLLNGLTFGLLGSSPEEIAANAAAKGEVPTTEDKDIAKTLGVTPENMKLLERMAGIGPGMERVATAFERIDKLDRFSDNVNAIQKGLDISELSKYNNNMQEIARSLEDMNKALAEDNKGLFGGTGVASADLLKKMGGSGPSADILESLNSNMTSMKQSLSDIAKHTKATAANTD